MEAVTDKIMVSIGGIGVMLFIFWFFLLKRGKEVKVVNSVDIVVSGGYSPEVVSIPFGQTTKLNFIRKDPTECLEEVVLGDFKVRRTLPLNEKVTVEITPKQKGEFPYSCGMGMFHGKIVVR